MKVKSVDCDFNIQGLLVIVALCCALNQTLWAQKDTGSIVGNVKDSSGAVIPNAKVTVGDMDKGTTFVTSTSTSGDYVASPLTVGRYSVTVEKQGFKTAITREATGPERFVLFFFLQSVVSTNS